MYPKFSNVHEQFSMSDGSSFGGINRNLKSEERCSWVRVTPISDGFICPNTVTEFVNYCFLKTASSDEHSSSMHLFEPTFSNNFCFKLKGKRYFMLIFDYLFLFFYFNSYRAYFSKLMVINICTSFVTSQKK